jgi:hypothetical protein
MARWNGSTNCGGPDSPRSNSKTDVSFANVMVSTQYVQSLCHHIGSLADIGHVVQESLPPWPPAIGPSIQDNRPAIAGRAARLSARVTRVAPVLPSSAQEQPLRLAAAVRLVSWSQVFWRPAFWCPEAAAQRA